MRITLCLFISLYCLPSYLSAQNTRNQSKLTIDQIMQGEAFVGFLPERIRWTEDSKTVLFSWNPNKDTLRQLYKVAVDGTTPVKVELEEEKELSRRGAYSSDQKKMVYLKYGDIYLMDLEKGTTLQITNTLTNESNPQFADDDQFITFQMENNVYKWSIKNGTLHQLTNLKKGREPAEEILNDQEQWLEEDQLAYFDILEERKTIDELEGKRNEALRPERPEPFYIGKKRVSNIRTSPDLKFISFRLTNSENARRTKVPDYVTASGYVDILNARPKVGSGIDKSENWIYNVERDSFYKIDLKQIPGIFDKPQFLQTYHKDSIPYNSQYNDPRNVIMHGPIYAEDGKAAVVVRSFDNKDRWIMLLNQEDGSLKLLDRQRDEAWVGGPGISGWNYFAGNVGWMPDNEHFYFQSEKTGFSQLYTVNVSNGKQKTLTTGEFEIYEVEIAKDKSKFYITANAEGPHERHFYHLPISGGKLQKVTGPEGNHQVTISPDEKFLAVRYSYANKPWELFLMENRPGADMKQLTQSTTKDFEAYPWREPEIIQFKARDGVNVPARLYRPKNAKAKGPAVIFVHGAGYLQNVHKWWSSYYREYMFHNILADNGFTVLDIDYRASQGYGRDWRTAIYQHMGGQDLEDQIDGAQFLAEKYDVDPDRIGIYGGSYGGFITLMALFTAPGTFKCGAALRSVTDWAHYNHSYTSNILNTPLEDSIAYRKSSPIYHAEGLQDHLLILHGMIDTNVQFQDVVRLAQRLIELRKDNWEFAVFPLEGHGFVESTSWADEYSRIFKLMDQHLKTE